MEGLEGWNWIWYAVWYLKLRRRRMIDRFMLCGKWRRCDESWRVYGC